MICLDVGGFHEFLPSSVFMEGRVGMGEIQHIVREDDLDLWGPWEQQEGHLGVQNQMTESTPWSDWSCSGKALIFFIEGIGETWPVMGNAGGIFTQKKYYLFQVFFTERSVSWVCWFAGRFS